MRPVMVPRPSIWASNRSPSGLRMTSTPCAFTDPSKVVMPLNRGTPPAIVSGAVQPFRRSQLYEFVPLIAPSEVRDTPA